MQIVPFLEQREELHRQAKLKRSTERITKHVGFRWVVEGLVGGDLSSLEPRELETNSVIEPTKTNSTETKDGNTSKETVKTQWKGLLAQLRQKKPVLVGHNVFSDLVNFYKCFIGTLPERIEDFKAAIRELFPVVIDTKYLATYDQSLTPATSSLVEINTALRDVQSNIVLDNAHAKYFKDSPDHEAGYDSYITAQALIRLTTKLHRAEPTPAKVSNKGFDETGNSSRESRSNASRAPELKTQIHDNPSQVEPSTVPSPSIISRGTQSSKPSDDLLGLEVQPENPPPGPTRLLPPAEPLIDPSKLLLGPPTPANSSDNSKSKNSDTPDWYHMPSLSSAFSRNNSPRLSLFANVASKESTNQIVQTPRSYDAPSTTSAPSSSHKNSTAISEQTWHDRPVSHWSRQSYETGVDTQAPGSVVSKNASTVTDNASSAPKPNFIKPSWRNKRSVKHAHSKQHTETASAVKESQKPTPSWTQPLIPQPSNPRPEPPTCQPQSSPCHDHSRSQSVYSSTSLDESKSTQSNLTSPPSSGALFQANIKFMPPFEHAFWDKFRNKLRVYGTADEMCDLASGATSPELSKDPSTWLAQPLQPQLQVRSTSGDSNPKHPASMPLSAVAGKLLPLAKAESSDEPQGSDGDSVCPNVDNDPVTASSLTSPAISDSPSNSPVRIDSPQVANRSIEPAKTGLAEPNLLDDFGYENEAAVCENAIVPTVSTSEEAIARTRMRRLSDDSADMWLER